MSPDPIYKKIGALIQSRRKMLGLKQLALADQLRISRGSLANIECGRQGILVHQLYRFAEALKFSPHDLLPLLHKEEFDAGAIDLPLPQNLNLKQQGEVARFMLQTHQNETTDLKNTRGKTTK